MTSFASPLKSALITGGSRGIGLAIAQRFAREGIACTLVARDPDRLKKAVSTLHDPERHSIAPGDVGDVRHWRQLFSPQNKSQNPPIDILVNAAGISQNGLLVTLPEQETRDILTTNLFAPTMACKHFMRYRYRYPSEDSKACIINISSLLAHHKGRGASVYAASKAGLIALTRTLVDEGRRQGIRANVISPGYIETDMTRKPEAASPSASQDPAAPAVETTTTTTPLERQIPAGRFGTADEVADAAWFLVRNEYANNCVLNLDGGLSAVL